MILQARAFCIFSGVSVDNGDILISQSIKSLLIHHCVLCIKSKVVSERPVKQAADATGRGKETLDFQYRKSEEKAREVESGGGKELH